MRKGIDPSIRFCLISWIFVHNTLMKRYLLRRQSERFALGGRRLSKPLTSCRVKRHWLGHLTTHCGTRCNSLASKIVRLLSESLIGKRIRAFQGAESSAPSVLLYSSELTPYNEPVLAEITIRKSQYREAAIRCHRVL